MATLIAAGHALRAASKASHDGAIDDNGRENDIADESHARTFALRPFDASALDLSETGSVSSLELPKTLTSERVRRRSEIARIRPLELDPEAIELPVISEHAPPHPHALVASSSASTHARGPDVTFRKDVVFVPSRGDDVELMSSFPSSLAPSIRIDDADADDADTVPAISAAQKAVYRRRFLISFVTLCFAFFLNGWNDGTVGPLLPRVQSFYGVRSPVLNGAGCKLICVHSNSLVLRPSLSSLS